jgi:hypothetical protein
MSRRVVDLFDLPREELESGRIDLAMPVVCIMRSNHPVPAHELTMQRFAHLQYAVAKYSAKVRPGFIGSGP